MEETTPLGHETHKAKSVRRMSLQWKILKQSWADAGDEIRKEVETEQQRLLDLNRQKDITDDKDDDDDDHDEDDDEDDHDEDDEDDNDNDNEDEGGGNNREKAKGSSKKKAKASKKKAMTPADYQRYVEFLVECTVLMLDIASQKHQHSRPYIHHTSQGIC